MIATAREFISLRTSDDPSEYHRAAWEEAPVEVWLELIDEYPEYREWVAHNKTIPIRIIEILARDPSWRVRVTIARKRKTPPELLAVLAEDATDSVRLAVALHPRVSRETLMRLAQDPWDEIQAAVRQRLAAPE